MYCPIMVFAFVDTCNGSDIFFTIDLQGLYKGALYHLYNEGYTCRGTYTPPHGKYMLISHIIL